MAKHNPSPPPAVTPLILSGGAGTRLWPISRLLHPKQFHPLASPRSSLQETALRVSGSAFAEPLVICNHEHGFLVAEQLRDVAITPSGIVLEPVGRNTAPATAVAALLIGDDDPGRVMLVLPSDHVIKDVKKFHQAVEVAAGAARQGALVAFGITPDRPETGYGYIKRGAPLKDRDGCFEIARFVEKPDLETARTFLEAGDYYWNSGMFAFTAECFLEELERLRPDILEGCRQALAEGRRDKEFLHLGPESFGEIDSQSIDYAVMEHTDKAVVVPVDMGWSDIGSWASLWEIGDKDGQGNVLSGDVLALDTENCLLRGQGPLVAAVGLRDMVVVALDDAVLVAAMDKAGEVKALVERLKDDGRPQPDTHLMVHRPWGHFTVLKTGRRFLVKQLTLKPGGQLSVQSHQHRAEHWTVVEGLAKVTLDGDTSFLGEDQSTYIPVGAKHSLANAGEVELHVIEVQSGARLDEDDIERFGDIYGRA